MHRLRKTGILAITAVLLSYTVGMSATAAGTLTRADYASIAAVLAHSKTQVLVLTRYPSAFGHVVVSAQAGDRDTQGGYQIVLGPVPNCDGSNACTFATVSGHAIDPGATTGMPRTVVDGKSVYFLKGKCGVNCNGSTRMVFMDHRAQYEIAVKAGSLEDVLILKRGLRALRSF